MQTDRPAGLADHAPDLSAVPGSPVLPDPYPVGDVKGGCPAEFTVTRGDLTYRVFGTGEPVDGEVLFRQQDLGWDWWEIRTWLITAPPNGIAANPDPIDPNSMCPLHRLAPGVRDRRRFTSSPVTVVTGEHPGQAAVYHAAPAVCGPVVARWCRCASRSFRAIRSTSTGTKSRIGFPSNSL